MSKVNPRLPDDPGERLAFFQARRLAKKQTDAYASGFAKGARLKSERVRLYGAAATEADWAAGFDAGRRQAEAAVRAYRELLELRARGEELVPFCACGRRPAECDGSRLGCSKPRNGAGKVA